jgi:1,4-alpha-glucan branching enzyme/maltooligosyltrehalose trehalohydrolase
MRASTLRWDERARPWHAEMLRFHEELLAIRAREIVPRLASGVHGEGYELLAERAISVRWRFGDGSRLTLVANVGERAVNGAGETAGEPLYRLGDAPAGARWSVTWYLAP